MKTWFVQHYDRVHGGWSEREFVRAETSDDAIKTVQHRLGVASPKWRAIERTLSGGTT